MKTINYKPKLVDTVNTNRKDRKSNMETHKLHWVLHNNIIMKGVPMIGQCLRYYTSLKNTGQLLKTVAN